MWIVYCTVIVGLHTVSKVRFAEELERVRVRISVSAGLGCRARIRIRVRTSA